MNSEQYWNDVFMRIREAGLQNSSSWLDRYEMYFQEKRIKRVLEIGCGSGGDTRYLVSKGYQVTATDFSEVSLDLVGQHVPEAKVVHHDTRHPFLFGAGAFDLILGSLTLHYFSSGEMKLILSEIRRMLATDGLLLVRLNSKNDEDASKEHPIDRYFYSIESCRSLFGDGWIELVLEETTQVYYGKKKMLIEGLFQPPTIFPRK